MTDIPKIKLEEEKIDIVAGLEKVFKFLVKLSVVALFIIVFVIKPLIFVIERREGIAYSLTNYEDTMLMKETTNGIDSNWKNINRKQSIIKGLTIAVLEASESGKMVSPLPSK
jgi:hypothetical protein